MLSCEALMRLALLALCVSAETLRSSATSTDLRAATLHPLHQVAFKLDSVQDAKVEEGSVETDDEEGKDDTKVEEGRVETDDEEDNDNSNDEGVTADTKADDPKEEVQEVQDVRKRLWNDMKEVQEHKKKASKDLSRFQDDLSFTAKLAEEQKVVASETHSKGLARVLREMREEIRRYATPAYTEHLQKKVADLDQKEKELEKKLKAPQEGEDSTGETSKDKSSDDAEELQKLQKEVTQGKEEVGHVFALAFVGTIIMLSMVFAMANSTGKDGNIRNYAWFLIDQVTAIFLAVMYFQAFDDLLDFLDFGGHYKLLTSVAHAMVILCFALLLAYLLREQEVGLAILCGAGAHVVSFSSVHAATSAQHHWLTLDYRWVTCLIGMAVLALALAVIGYCIWKGKQAVGVSKDDDFMDKTDDLENDFGAMAFSVVWTMFVRFLLTGHHPVDDDTEFDHTTTNRNMMLGYAFFALFAGAVIVKYLSSIQSVTKSYGVKRLTGFGCTVAAMNVAWAFFYWAEWTLFETVFEGQPVFGRIAFALLSTCVGGLGIIGLSSIRNLPKSVSKVSLTTLALVVAWSWELTFDAAIDSMCEGESHPAVWKIGIAVLMFVVVIPVYAIYMKPISSPCVEAIG